MKDFFKRITAAASAAALMLTAQVQLVPWSTIHAEDATSEKKVLLIQDNLPWDSNANTEILDSIGVEYQKVTTSQFLDVELEDYAVVIFANDQSFSTYNNYLDFKDYMEIYASLGGVIIFGASDAGWADGSLTGDLPGNVEKIQDFSYYNYVADMTHPIITAELTDGNGAAVEGRADSMWYSNYCSHSEFNEATLPAGANVLVRSSNTDNPTLVEYPLGNGRVIASGLTYEHSYSYRDNYAKRILDDLFLYAIRVSDLDGDSVEQLRDYRLSVNKHHIIVSSADTKEPIAGAQVQIGDDVFVTDESGLVSIDGRSSKETVIVSADGYLTTATMYTPQKRRVHVFYLQNDDSNGKPYAVMATETIKDKDLFTKTVYYNENENDTCKIKVIADWNGHTPGTYELVQYGNDGVRLKSTTGNFSFAPGMKLKPEKSVYLVLKSADGTISNIRKLNIVIKKNTPEAPAIDPSQFDDDVEIIPSQSASTGSDDVESLVGDDFEIDLGPIPVSVSGEGDDDAGTYTIRMMIGVEAGSVDDYNKAKKDKENYNYMKSLLDSYMEDVDKASNRIESLCEKINQKVKDNKFPGATHDIKPLITDKGVDVNAMGYYEIVYDANSNIISQGGGIAITIEGEASHTQQFMLAVIPIYLTVKGEAGLEVLSGMTFKSGGGVSYQGEVTLTVGGSISAGVGLNGICSVGAGGGAEFEIGVAPDFTGDFTLHAFVEASLLFVIDFQYDFASKTWRLWPRNGNLPKRYADEDEEISYEFLNQSYLANSSDWNGSVDSSQLNVLMSSLLPTTVPVIAEAGGNKVMVWQTTDPAADIMNSTKLMASYYSNGVWSEPQLVCESDGADLNAELTAIDDDIYLIWQKQNAVIENDDVMNAASEAAASVDIFTAVWNGTEFDSISCVLDDDTFDMLPELVSDGDKLTAVWVKNGSDIFDLAGSVSTIMASDLVDGQWSAPYVLGETDKYISELTASYTDGKLCAAYISTDINDGSVNELHVIADGSDRTISSESDIITGVTFNNGKIYCAGSGVLYSCTPYDDALTAEAGELNTLTGSFTFADDGSSIIFADGTTFYLSVNENGVWSKAIELTTPEGFDIYNYSASSVDGAYSVVMNGRDADKNTSLVYIEPVKNESIVLNFAELITDTETGEQSVMLNITNNETRTIDSVSVELSNGADTLISTTEAISLAPGQSLTLDYPVDTTGIAEVTDYTLTLTDGVYTVTDVVTVGKPDIALEVESYYVGDQVILAIKASNLTETPAEAAIKIREDSADGLQIDMKNAGVITNEEDYLLLEQINLSDIEFNESGAKYFFINAETLSDEITDTNNAAIVAVYKADEEPENTDDSDLTVYDVTDTDAETDDTANADEETAATTTTIETTTTTTTASSETTVVTTTTTTSAAASKSSSANSPKTGDIGTKAAAGMIFAIAAAAALARVKKKNEE